MANISQNLPEIGQQFQIRIDTLQQFIQDTFGIDRESQSRYLRQIGTNLLENSSLFIRSTISGTSNIFTGLIITPIAVFFLLYYREFYKKFLMLATPEAHHEQVKAILDRVQGVVQGYFSGLLIVMAIIASLNTLGLLVIGVKYAFFWGILSALLNIIPFIGVFIGSLFPILFSLITMDSLWYPVVIALWFWFVQWIEGDFITPTIVGNRVELNPFTALLALIMGAEIWGATGMIVSIPFLAILKIFFDSVPSMKTYGFILGLPERLKEPLSQKLANKIKTWLIRKKK
jgi:predicted PurR-regulated permease PerM